MKLYQRYGFTHWSYCGVRYLDWYLVDKQFETQEDILSYIDECLASIGGKFDLFDTTVDKGYTTFCYKRTDIGSTYVEFKWYNSNSIESFGYCCGDCANPDHINDRICYCELDGKEAWHLVTDEPCHHFELKKPTVNFENQMDIPEEKSRFIEVEFEGCGSAHNMEQYAKLSLDTGDFMIKVNGSRYRLEIDDEGSLNVNLINGVDVSVVSSGSVYPAIKIFDKSRNAIKYF